MQYLLHHKRDLQCYMQSLLPEKTYRIQRFICPSGLAFSQTLLRWRRTKESKCYTITTRSSGKPAPKKPPVVTDPSQFSLDPWYLASSVYSPNCDVTKERFSEEMETLVEALRDVIGRFVLSPEERLEELVVFTVRGIDGKLYFLDCPKARTSVVEAESVGGQQRCLLLATLLKGGDVGEGLKQKLLPYICLKDMCDDSRKLYEMQLSHGVEGLSESPRVRSDSEELVSKHLSAVSAQFDSLVHESQQLKKEFGIVMKVQLNRYPKSTLESIIFRVYEKILRDPRLAKYYSDRASIRERLTAAVKSVFMNGLSRNIKARMRTVHAGMGITDADFDLYVMYFVQAMRDMEVDEDDIEQTKEFLNEFRGDVVQRLLDSSQ